MTNPWSRENFDLGRQKEIVNRGDYREVNGFLLDAGWKPEEAHSFILHVLRAKAMSEEMEEFEQAAGFIGNAHQRASDAQRKMHEAIRRAEDEGKRNGAYVSRSGFNGILLNVYVCLAVVVLGLWLTA